MPTNPTPEHDHYYLSPVVGGKRHLVTARMLRRSCFTVLCLCGHEVRRSSVRRADRHRHVSDWLDRYGDDLCGHCVRYATSDPDLAWEEQRIAVGGGVS